MGKHGPCCHCGVTSTPLWRNGPPEKPVLCNACGSRWRTKGSLTNYTPMHARDPLDPEDFKVTKTKSISIKLKEQKPLKKKQSNGLLEINNQRTHHDQNFRKILEEDTSNRSSTGSAVSFSGSCAHLGTTDASDLTGSAQSNVWDSLVPSRKRTCVARPRPSQFEKLTKDLYSIWYQQQSSYLSGSSEEDLLYESGTPFGSDEIGHGGVLIRRPNSKTLDEESEASSIPIDNKPYVLNDVYSSSASISMCSENRGTCSSHVGVERLRNSTAEMLQVQAKRDNKPCNDKLQIIRNRDSPLCSTELKDVLNFEVFIANLTHEEQQKLMRFLPFVDVAKQPESLKSMFSSSQFSETCSYFQHLIADGVFDTSFVSANVEECRSLKRLVLLNLTKSKWVERYKELKEAKCKTGGNDVGGKENACRPSFDGFAKLTPLKRICESENTNFREMKGSTRSPKRSIRPGVMSSLSTKLPPQQNTDEFVDNEGICFSPRSLFATPPCRSSMLTSLNFTDDSSDQDLLLEVPCNAPTPEAELLYPPWKQKPNAAPAESVIAVGEESLSDFPVSSISSQQQMHH